MARIDCPTCGKPGYESDDTLRALRNDLDWDELRWADKGSVFSAGPLGAVEVVADIPALTYDSYGQGIEDDVFVVVKLPDGRLFKREAWRDSYGSCEWKIEIREVKSEPRTITVFDYV